MFNVKFKVKDGRNSLPRPSSRSSQRSSSPSSVRTQRSRSADRTKITKITKNGQTITTVVDGKLTYGNCKSFRICIQRFNMFQWQRFVSNSKLKCHFARHKQYIIMLIEFEFRICGLSIVCAVYEQSIVFTKPSEKIRCKQMNLRCWHQIVCVWAGWVGAFDSRRSFVI